mmetsp:Transcript_6216/g.10851  ORF Transcript_6216/g.10851 Transcript_6216/m.10851 type:complete len:87 (+) Transcript_6216:75-335(+)
MESVLPELGRMSRSHNVHKLPEQSKLVLQILSIDLRKYAQTPGRKTLSKKVKRAQHSKLVKSERWYHSWAACEHNCEQLSRNAIWR